MGAAANARWVGVSQGVRVLTQLAGVAVLARMLSPSDYGVMAMASVVTTLASMLRDLGTASAIVQKRELDDPTINAVFWFNLAMGLLIGAVTVAASKAIAVAFLTDELVPVLCALALAFPLSASATAHQALLERRSSFAVLARIEVFSAVISLGIAVVAAGLGAGVYSLVAQALASACLSSCQLWIASNWRPNMRPRWSDLSALLGFGGNLAAFNLINFAARNADSAIIGRYLGSVALGNYSVAYKLMLFPLQNLTFVASRALFPVMSRQQDDIGKMADLYLRSVRVIVMITAPMMAGAFVLREPLVLLLFGDKWIKSAEVLAWLAPTGFIQSIVSTTGTVFMARGRTDALMRQGVFAATLYVTAFALGVSQGVVGVASYYFFANMIFAIPCLILVMRQLDSNFYALIRAIAPALMSSLFMVLIMSAIRSSNLLGTNSLWADFSMSILIGGVAYLLCFTLVLRQGIKDVVKILKPT